MIIENAEVETQGTWGDKETSQSWTDRNRCRGTSQNISQHRGEPFSTSRNDRERRDTFGRGKQSNAGGIIDRLVSKTLEQISEAEQRLADLREELADLKKLSEQTIHQVNEE